MSYGCYIYSAVLPPDVCSEDSWAGGLDHDRYDCTQPGQQLQLRQPGGIKVQGPNTSSENLGFWMLTVKVYGGWVWISCIIITMHRIKIAHYHVISQHSVEVSNPYKWYLTWVVKSKPQSHYPGKKLTMQMASGMHNTFIRKNKRVCDNGNLLWNYFPDIKSSQCVSVLCTMCCADYASWGVGQVSFPRCCPSSTSGSSLLSHHSSSRSVSLMETDNEYEQTSYINIYIP